MSRPDPPAAPPPASGTIDDERLVALQADNQRLRDLLAAAGRLAEFGRFAAKQNHELRQPLFAIKGLAQLLLERSQIDVDEARDFARHIVEQSERLTRLVGDMRHLSIPAPPTHVRVADVSPVLLRVTSLLDWRFRKGVILRTEIAPDLPQVGASPQELEQVLLNLLSNALDAVAGRPQPIVQVRVGTSASSAAPPAGNGGQAGHDVRVEISVADNGQGVAKTVRDRLFETFFTTKGEEAGTGLGLAVSREIARGVGGELELLAEPGTWSEPAVTVFRLSLPSVEEPSSP